MSDVWVLKMGYCPICERDWGVQVFTCETSFHCPRCGHHLALHVVEEKEKEKEKEKENEHIRDR